MVASDRDDELQGQIQALLDALHRGSLLKSWAGPQSTVAATTNTTWLCSRNSIPTIAPPVALSDPPSLDNDRSSFSIQSCRRRKRIIPQYSRVPVNTDPLRGHSISPPHRVVLALTPASAFRLKVPARSAVPQNTAPILPKTEDPTLCEPIGGHFEQVQGEAADIRDTKEPEEPMDKKDDLDQLTQICELKTFGYQERVLARQRPRVPCSNPDFFRRYAMETAMMRVGKLSKISARPLKLAHPTVKGPEMVFGIQCRLSRRRPRQWQEITADDFNNFAL